MLSSMKNIFLCSNKKAVPSLPYDAEVEYLQSTGATTYMLLPLVWRATTHVEVTWQRVNRYAQPIFGCRTNNNNTVCVSLYHERNNDNLSRARWHNYTKTTYGEWWSGAAIQQRKETVTIDYPTLTMTYSLGTKTISAFDATLRNNTTALFGIGNSTGTGLDQAAAVRIFTFKAFDATGDLYDLQPVRFTNEQGQSEGAMYDRLGVGGMNPDGSPRTDGLYRNRGTGAFLYGADKENR